MSRERPQRPLRPIAVRIAVRTTTALTPVLVAGLVLSGPAGAAQRAAGLVAASATASTGTLPPCAAGDRPVHRLRPSKLKGPARSDERDHVVTTAWSLDHHKLRVAPPPAAATTAVGISTAACNLIAAFTPNNFDVAGIVGSGSTLALGEMTIGSGTRLGVDNSGGVQDRSRPARYDHRLAWILTVSFAPPTSCPAQPAKVRSSSEAAATAKRVTHFYEIFAVDAQTGADPIEYSEATPQPCGFEGWVSASRDVPREQLSLPWTLRSIDHSRQNATLTTTYSRCGNDGVDGDNLVGRPNPEVLVEQTRELEPICAPERTKTVRLRPATVTRTIPHHLIHARVGPVDWPS